MHMPTPVLIVSAVALRAVALCNLCHTDAITSDLVDFGVVPVLISLAQAILTCALLSVCVRGHVWRVRVCAHMCVEARACASMCACICGLCIYICVDAAAGLFMWRCACAGEVG